jgi:IS30 family transposase
MRVDKTVQQINEVAMGLFEQIEATFRKGVTFDNDIKFWGYQTVVEAVGPILFLSANPYHF